jgi:hypothetical protein
MHFRAVAVHALSRARRPKEMSALRSVGGSHGSLAFTVLIFYCRQRLQAERGERKWRGRGGVVTYVFWGLLTSTDGIVQAESREAVSYYNSKRGRLSMRILARK